MNARTEILPRSTVNQICGARAKSLDMMASAVEEISAAYRAAAEARKAGMAAHYGAVGVRGSDTEEERVSDLTGKSFKPSEALEAYRRDLDRRVWAHLMDATGMRQMMDRQAREELDKSLRGEVIEATEENVRATLERLYADSDLIFMRGLAKAFAQLEPRFKSHDAFKIGSRMIITGAASADGYLGYDGVWHTIADIERVFAVLDKEKPDAHGLREAIQESRRGVWGPRQSEAESRYFKIRMFKNGNAHLWFMRDDLVEKANKVLGEYYGEVLPDAYDEGDGSNLFTKSTAVSKDLQFYRSPTKVVEALTDNLYLGKPGARVLEPSAGDGAIALYAAAEGAVVHAIEVDQDRCDLLRARARRLERGSVSIERANFLKVTPSPIYDFVLMNPPFYGTHWMAHVRHAWDFLAPGGILRAVLPASAAVSETPQHLAFRKWATPFNDWGWAGPFRDLPAESFAESGTRIQTVMLLMRKR